MMYKDLIIMELSHNFEDEATISLAVRYLEGERKGQIIRKTNEDFLFANEKTITYFDRSDLSFDVIAVINSDGLPVGLVNTDLHITLKETITDGKNKADSVIDYLFVPDINHNARVLVSKIGAETIMRKNDKISVQM